MNATTRRIGHGRSALGRAMPWGPLQSLARCVPVVAIVALSAGASTPTSAAAGRSHSDPPTELRFRLLEPDGSPLRHATLILTPMSGVMHPSVEATTDGDGHLRLQRPPSSQPLLVELASPWGRFPIARARQDEEEIRIWRKLARAEVSGRYAPPPKRRETGLVFLATRPCGEMAGLIGVALDSSGRFAVSGPVRPSNSPIYACVAVVERERVKRLAQIGVRNVLRPGEQYVLEDVVASLRRRAEETRIPYEAVRFLADGRLR